VHVAVHGVVWGAVCVAVRVEAAPSYYLGEAHFESMHVAVFSRCGACLLQCVFQCELRFESMYDAVLSCCIACLLQCTFEFELQFELQIELQCVLQ